MLLRAALAQTDHAQIDTDAYSLAVFHDDVINTFVVTLIEEPEDPNVKQLYGAQEALATIEEVEALLERGMESRHLKVIYPADYDGWSCDEPQSGTLDELVS